MSQPFKNVAILCEYNYERPFKIIDGILSYPGVRDKCRFRNFDTYQATRDALFTKEWQPDGVLVMYGENLETTSWIDDLEVPVVNMVETKRRLHPSVGVSHASMAEQIIDHFAALECESFLFTSTKGVGASDTLNANLSRLCEKKGIDYQCVHVPEQLVPSDVVRLDELCPELRPALAKRQGKMGVYSYHDRRGRLIVDYALSKGYSIPDEVAVLGCFDSVDARLCDPPLSSVMLPDGDLGAKAMEMLYELMSGHQLLERHVELSVRGVRVRGSTVGQDGSDLEVLRARNLIRERAHEGVTVEQIVDELKVSRSTFEKRFSLLTGHSPAQEIRKVRLELAREYLLTTDLPLTQIAPMVGFMDRRAFMVFFKREAGMTPGAFRETHK